MAALRDSLDASASCTLPAVPLHWQYSWDAENRLVAVAPAVPAAGDKKVVYTYDYMSRRVQKRVFAWNATLNGATGDWEANPEVYQRFVYDQWNVVLVLDGTDDNAITHKYTWGLDLGGLAGTAATPKTTDRLVFPTHSVWWNFVIEWDGATLGYAYTWGPDLSGRATSSASDGISRSAGGVGGLLAAVDTCGPHAGSYWFLYDGHGNVCQLLKADDQSLAASYEYDPYGGGLAISGPYGSANMFRFSTKWLDAELGGSSAGGVSGAAEMYYFGCRVYIPGLGRWLSPDPLGYAGGPHPYSYVTNAPFCSVDPLGLLSWGDVVNVVGSGVSGAAAGAGGGAVTGLGVGAALGALAGGVGALPGAIAGAKIGALAGAISGAISGVATGINGVNNGSITTVGAGVKAGAISGGISGAASGVAPAAGAIWPGGIGLGTSAVIGWGSGGAAGALIGGISSDWDPSVIAGSAIGNAIGGAAGAGWGPATDLPLAPGFGMGIGSMCAELIGADW